MAVSANQTYSFSATVVTNPNGLPANALLAISNGPAGVTSSFKVNGANVDLSYVPSAGDVLAVVVVVSSTAGTIDFRLGAGTAGSVTGSVTLKNPQLEVGSTATAYQTVTTAYSVTQAPYAQAFALVADGVDDFMVSPTLDLSAYNKVAVYTAVRKVSDAAAIIMESSANSAVNPGSFNSSALTSGVYALRSTGGISAVAQTAGVYFAPITNVISGAADIAGDSIILRVNGTQAAASSADQGAANYGSYPLYLFMRGGTASPFKGAWYGATIAAGITPSAAQTAWAEAQFSNLCRQA